MLRGVMLVGSQMAGWKKTSSIMTMIVINESRKMSSLKITVVSDGSLKYIINWYFTG